MDDPNKIGVHVLIPQKMWKGSIVNDKSQQNLKIIVAILQNNNTVRNVPM
jgi:hypothetical protein